MDTQRVHRHRKTVLPSPWYWSQAVCRDATQLEGRRQMERSSSSFFFFCLACSLTLSRSLCPPPSSSLVPAWSCIFIPLVLFWDKWNFLYQCGKATYCKLSGLERPQIKTHHPWPMPELGDIKSLQHPAHWGFRQRRDECRTGKEQLGHEARQGVTNIESLSQSICDLEEQE